MEIKLGREEAVNRFPPFSKQLSRHNRHDLAAPAAEVNGGKLARVSSPSAERYSLLRSAPSAPPGGRFHAI